MHPCEPNDRVVVVGAGVSGCACAVTLAEAGMAVTLVNSALDVVGLPGYGPDLWLTDRDAWVRVPRRLREAWERWSQVPDELPAPETASAVRGARPTGAEALQPDAGRACADAVSGHVLVTDRRAVSLETKQLIESFPQIDLRQGLVVDVRPSTDETGRIEVETAFGDVIGGAACVLAVGLGLAGRVTEGGREIAGARYGEVAADALYEVLRERGVLFAAVEREVGDHLVGWKPDHVLREGPLRSHRALHLRSVVASGSTRGGMPGEGLVVPPGPHESIGAQRSGVWSGARDVVQGQLLPAERSGIFPDEVATGEWYRSSGFEDEAGADGLRPRTAAEGSCRGGSGVHVVRRAHRVRGQAIVSLDEEGRLEGQRSTWVVGQAAGARTYLESLVDGVRGALAVAAALSATGPEAASGGPALGLAKDGPA